VGWDPGIQGRERVLTDTVAAANRAILDLSFGLAPVCCHRAYQTKRVSGNLGSWDSIITSKTLTETIRKNLAFDQPERWFCGMLFLGQSASISQHICSISSSFPVNYVFQLWWVLKLQS
jgi:hypothetical protein